MTWCHHYRITLQARHIQGCLNVMADALSRSNQTQSTEWSLHLQVFKQICQNWFTPHVDLFATHLHQKLPMYVSPVPDQHAWDIDVEHKLVGFHSLCLPSHGSPSRDEGAMQLPHHTNSPRRGHGGRVVTLSPPTSEAGVRSPSGP